MHTSTASFISLVLDYIQKKTLIRWFDCVFRSSRDVAFGYDFVNPFALVFSVVPLPDIALLTITGIASTLHRSVHWNIVSTHNHQSEKYVHK